MKYIAKVRVAEATLKTTPLNEEMMCREVARKLVNEMPIDLLKTFLQIDKLDPSRESLRKAREQGDSLRVNELFHLAASASIEYTATAIIPEQHLERPTSLKEHEYKQFLAQQQWERERREIHDENAKR